MPENLFEKNDEQRERKKIHEIKKNSVVTEKLMDEKSVMVLS